MDTSKQALGAGILHMLNLAVAEAIGEMDESSNKCTWYFLNFSLDTFLGIGLCYLLLRAMENWLARFEELAFKTGFYGDPPSWRSWSYQAWIWLLIVILMKTVCVISIFLLSEPLAFFGDLLLAPFAISAELELVMVMIIIPVICNSLVFWVTDSYLKFTVIKKTVIDGAYEDMEILEMNSYNMKE
jgi:hypothetical protein